MDPALQAYAAAAAVIVAMLIFAGLTLFGVRIVRWLSLPNELPDELRYAPPPPPPRAATPGGEAREIAARQGKLAALHGSARETARCYEAVAELQMAVSGTVAEPVVASAAARIGEAVAEADAALAKGGDEAVAVIARARGAAEAALAEARTAAATVPGGNRRLVLLAVLVVVMLLLLALTIAMRPEAGALSSR